MIRKLTDIFTLDNLPFFKGLQQKGTNAPQSTNTSPFFLLRGLDGSTFAFRSVGIHEAIRNFKEIAPINTAINKIAKAVGGLDCVLIDKETREKVREHDLLKLLNHPNADIQKTKRDFFRDLVIWKTLTGNAYLSARGPIKRPPLELFVFSSNFVTPEAKKNGFIDTYRYKSSFETEIYRRDSKDRFITENKDAELYDIMNVNLEFSNKVLRGMSEIESLFFEINHYLFASRHNLSMLGNGARPSGAFVLKSRKDGMNALLNDDSFARLKNEIQTAYTGAENVGRPMILEGGMEFQQISMNAVDMDFKKLKDDSEKQIYKNLEVPIELIMAEGTTFGNMGSVRLEFYENNILPLADDIFLHLERFLLPRYRDGDRFHLKVDRESIEALAPKRAEKRKVIENSIVLTVNEKRAEFNLKPIEGGNKITDPNGRPIAGEDAGELVGGDPDSNPDDNEEIQEEPDQDVQEEPNDET